MKKIVPTLPSLPSKPAHQSVTLWGLATVALGIGVRIASKNGIDLAGTEDQIAGLLEGVGILIAGYGRTRTVVDQQDVVTPRPKTKK